MNCSLLGSSVHGIFQARVPEWVDISFSNLAPHFLPNRPCSPFGFSHTLSWPSLCHAATEFATLSSYSCPQHVPRQEPHFTLNISIHYPCMRLRLCVCGLSQFSHIWHIFATLWTGGGCQAPLYVGFCRQEYWGGLPCPPPGDLPGPGIKPASLKSPALTGEFFTATSTWEALHLDFTLPCASKPSNHIHVVSLGFPDILQSSFLIPHALLAIFYYSPLMLS